MSYAELTPEARMNELQKSLQQVHDYTGHEERGNAVLRLLRRSQSHYAMMEQLEEGGRLAHFELQRWQKIKADYRSAAPEMFLETL